MTICTVVTKSHLAGARVLARSIKAVHPDAEVYALLADRVDACFDPDAEPFHTVLLEQLNADQAIAEMSFYYNAFEFCNAVRPLMHQYLWQHTAAPAWIYLDSDIFVTGDLSDIFQSLAGASVLLNPHNTSPASAEFFLTTELAELQVGIFNSGFVGVRRCDEAKAFINWFRSRLRRFCFHDGAGMFVDQMWLMHVPQYFRDVLIYTNPGANVAHWNLYKRSLARAPDGASSRYLADGKPLMFVHFSGWDFADPLNISRFAPAYQKLALPQMDVWNELAQRYRDELLTSGIETCRTWPYAFDRFDDGTPVTLAMRRKYFGEVVAGKSAPASPFSRPGDFSNA